MKSVEVKVKTIQELKQSALAGLPSGDEPTQEESRVVAPTISTAASSAFKRIVPQEDENNNVIIGSLPIDRIEKPQKTKPMRKYLPAYPVATAPAASSSSNGFNNQQPQFEYSVPAASSSTSSYVNIPQPSAIPYNTPIQYCPESQVPPPPVYPQQHQATPAHQQQQHCMPQAPQPFYRSSQHMYHTNYPAPTGYYAPPQQAMERLPSIHELLNGTPKPAMM